MKKVFFIVALFLIISNLALAQQPGLGGSGGGMMRRSIPNVTRAVHPFIKGEQSLAETWDATIAGYGNAPDGMTVNCFAEDSDNLYIGGDFLSFDTVASQFIVQYNRKTGLWSGLDYGMNNQVRSMALHDGYLYAAGTFTTAGSSDSEVNYIAVWDGAAWHSVGGGMNDIVNSIAFVGDTLYAGGAFSMAGGVTANNLAYWDGQNWNEAFGGTSYTVNCLFSTHDTLFVGGNFVYVGGQNSATGQRAFGIGMLQNGTWTTFGNDGCYASTLAFYQGQLWAGGDFYWMANGGYLVNDIAYWDGSNWNSVSADTSIGTDGTGPVNQLLVVGDTLLALGQFSSVDGVSAKGIAMFHNSIWSQVAGGLYGYGTAAIPFNGNLYVGGQFTKARSVNAMSIVSLSKGSWDAVASIASTLAGWASAEVRAIATTNRYVFIGGNFTTIAGQICNHVAAWDKQQKLWITLGPGVDGDVFSLAVHGDNLFVGGYFNQAGTVAAINIAEYNIATAQWSAMGTGARRSVSGIAVDGSGAVYAPIYNPQVGNGYYDYIGVWNGTSWRAFGNGLSSGYINALAWQGSILNAAGSFVKTDDGTQVNYVAQLQDSIWGPLNNGLNDEAYALGVSGDSLYVGGSFTQADGQAATSLAVWNDNAWNPIGTGFNREVDALASDGKGGIYAGGGFTNVAGVSRGNLVHWNGSAFGTVSSGVNNTVNSLATDQTALYVGGWFDEAGSTHVISLHFGALDGAGVSSVNTPLPDVASLSIFPNPASGTVNISLDLIKAGNIQLEVYNAIGARVALISNGDYEMGHQQFSYDASKLQSGIYFLRITRGGVVSTQNFIINRE